MPSYRRWLPDVPLPPYAFVPGRTPHPFADEGGHRYGADSPAPSVPDTARWMESAPYLLGLDLFNAGFHWESHEQWERLWHACGRRGPTADFLKALIHLAAAGVKHRAGVPAGVASHARRAAELLRALEPRRFMGLNVGALIAFAERIEREGWPTTTPQLNAEPDECVGDI